MSDDPTTDELLMGVVTALVFYISAVSDKAKVERGEIVNELGKINFSLLPFPSEASRKICKEYLNHIISSLSQS